jgi:hypothetical protein
VIIRQAFTDLALQVPANLPEPVLVIGMAESRWFGAGVIRCYNDNILMLCMSQRLDILWQTRHYSRF